MWKRKLTFTREQTPKQRKAQAAITRENDKNKLIQCNSMRFWRICEIAECKRRRTCAGDPWACFERHWRLVPEPLKHAIRAMVVARGDGASYDEALRAGIAAHAQWAEREAEFAKLDADAAKPATASTAAPTPQPAEQPTFVPEHRAPRIRSLWD